MKKRQLWIGLFLVLLVIYFFVVQKENQEINVTQSEEMASSNVASSAHASVTLPNSSFDIPIETWKTSSKTPVYFVAAQGLPIIDIEVLFNAGSARDDGKYGVGFLTNLLLKAGTKNHTEEEISQIFEDTGAQFAVDTHRDMARLSLRMLAQPDKRDLLINTLADILTEPSFKDDALVREKDRALIAIKAQSQSPSDLALKKFFEHSYPSHPYAHPVIGINDTVKQITTADLVAFYQKYYTAQNARVLIVGDIKAEEAKAIAEQLTRHLNSSDVVEAIKMPISTQAEEVRVPFHSTQTHIVMGMPLITRQDEDWPALYAANEILGGSAFRSRLFEKIRHQEGLAYSVGSHIQPMQVKGPYIFSLQTKQEEAEKAKQLLLSTVTEFLKNGPTETELSDTKNALIGELAVGLASNADLMSELRVIAFYDLPVNYLSQFVKQIQQLNCEQVRTAFAKHVNLDEMILVSVGESTGSKEAPATTPTAPEPTNTVGNDAQTL